MADWMLVGAVLVIAVLLYGIWSGERSEAQGEVTLAATGER